MAATGRPSGVSCSSSKGRACSEWEWQEHGALPLPPQEQEEWPLSPQEHEAWPFLAAPLLPQEQACSSGSGSGWPEWQAQREGAAGKGPGCEISTTYFSCFIRVP